MWFTKNALLLFPLTELLVMSHHVVAAATNLNLAEPAPHNDGDDGATATTATTATTFRSLQATDEGSYYPLPWSSKLELPKRIRDPLLFLFLVRMLHGTSECNIANL